jgi:hypothetical protein
MAPGAHPTVDVFIRSYHRDRAWLALALRAIRVHLRGHRRVVVVLPRASAERMGEMIEQACDQVAFHFCDNWADDYLGQQVTKLHADTYTDAQVILHMDADQLLLAPCDIGQLFDGHRVRVDYRAASNRPAGDGWGRCAADFFGQELAWDLTVPPPLAMPRAVYAGLREQCMERHGMALPDYALRRGADRFCEFALLRAQALLFAPERCSWQEQGPLPQCRTFWSRRETPAGIAAQLPASLRCPA